MDEAWYDDDAGTLVRPYTITGGRIPSKHSRLDRATQVVTVQPRPPAPRLELTPEHRTILDVCRRPASVAELGARLAQPLGVVRVLCSDLLDHGVVHVHSPTATVSHDVLKKVLDGLCRL
ncbi:MULTISPECIES: DUF742 domain-containing protein [Saccharopolyspora]|uniref:DUF742 domain-containing protein n=1 Tax=Saccharopolyspora cebuensis TaxID=418759 RepID=A0ABV4CGQ0_9PSEU